MQECVKKVGTHMVSLVTRWRMLIAIDWLPGRVRYLEARTARGFL